MTQVTTMKAIGFNRSLPIDAAESLFSFDAPYPVARPHDLIVRVSAVSVNPVDAKVRIRSAVDSTLATPTIPGFDAVGVVVGMGNAATGFQIGDRVFYAGDITRPGSNAQFQAVDARIAAKAPIKLTDAEAAVLPLTALTAWEALFDRLRVPTDQSKTLLLIGGAGGVGSIMIQLAKQLTNLTVIATASRSESIEWVRAMGADHVADHRDLVNSVKALGIDTVDYIMNTADTIGHWDATAELIAPQGMICSIVEFDGAVDLSKLQGKSAGFVWELMFTRSLFNTADIARQHAILTQVAGLADAGRVRTTLNETLSGFDVATLHAGHRKIESGKTVGKIAITF